MAALMVRGPDYGLAHARLLSRKLRELAKINLHNAMVEKKLYLLSYQAGRDHVIRCLGGKKKLSAWERRKASEAAKIAAAHRERPPHNSIEKWWLDKHHARLKAEAERTKHFARPNTENVNIYKGTPDYALEIIPRGPSPLRGCSLARRATRPPHRMNFLPTLYFMPSELRGEPENPLPPPAVKPQRRKRAREAAAKPAAPPNMRWEHISPAQARAEIFGEEARGSPAVEIPRKGAVKQVALNRGFRRLLRSKTDTHWSIGFSGE